MLKLMKNVCPDVLRHGNGNATAASACQSDQCNGLEKEADKVTVPESNAGNGFDPSQLPGTTDTERSDDYKTVKSVSSRIANTVFTILQIAAFVGIVLIGLKYMYTSSDQRADIKKNMIMLFVGMILVFASTTVVKFVTQSFNDSKTITGINGASYQVVEYKTDALCLNENINKKVTDKAGNVTYCTASGYCCAKESDGKYSYRSENSYLTDSFINNKEKEKTKEITITIPTPTKYEQRSQGYEKCQYFQFVGDSNDKETLKVKVNIFPDNTGEVFFTKSQGLYYLKDGAIYRNNNPNGCSFNSTGATVPGAEQVYKSDDLLYKNAK